MVIYYIALGLLVALAVVNIAVLGPLRRRMAESPETRSLSRLIRLSVASALSLILSTLFLSSLAVLAALEALQFVGGASAADVECTIARLQVWRTWIQDVEPVLGLVITFLIVGGLLYLTWRQARMTYGVAFHEARRREFEALVRQAKEGSLPEIEPNGEMRRQQTVASECLREQQAILQNARERDSAGDDEGPRLTDAELRRLKYLQEDRLEAERLYFVADLQRRMSGRLQEGDVEVSRPTSLGGKVLTFFLSRGHFRTLRFISKSLFVLGVFLLIPSLLAITSPQVALALDEELDRLEDVYVALSEQEAVESWKDYAGAADEPSPTASLTDDDLVAIDRMAVALEYAVAQRMADALRLRSTIERTTLRAQGARIRLFRIYGDRVDTLGMKVSMKPFGADAGLSDLGEAIVNFELDAAMNASRPATAFGQNFAERMERVAVELPPERWTAAIKSRVSREWDEFQTLSSRQQMRSLFVTHLVFDGAVEGVAVDESLEVFANNVEDLVPLERRRAALRSSQAEFLRILESDGMLRAVDVVGDASRPHLFGRGEIDDLYINAESFAGNDDFDRELRKFSPYLDEVTDVAVDRAAARRLAEQMATRGVAEGFELGDPLAALVEFSDVRSGPSGRPARVRPDVRSLPPGQRTSRLPSRPRFRFRL